jgi:glutathione S-transferase
MLDRRRALLRLKHKIARARARIRRHEMLLEQQLPDRHFVAEARLTAAKLRLAQLCLERQRVRSER